MYRFCSCILETYSCVYSEREDRLTRYEQWQKMREVAIQNSNGKLPEGFEENFPQPPPVDDLDIEKLSLDLSAASIDADIGNAIDDSGIERVSMADGIEVRTLA